METINLDLFSPKKAELQEAASKYASLRDKKVSNKDELKVVHDAEQELVKMRTGISKTRLDYTRQFDEAKRQAIGLEKELLGVISPVEEDLKARKKEYLDEQERIKQEELEKKRKFLQDRVDQLASFGYSHHDLHELSQMEQGEFQELLDSESHKYLERQKELEHERLIEKKNHYKSAILSSTTIAEIEEIEKCIGELELPYSEFVNDINAKKGMIEQQEKLAEQQRKIDEENARIQKEKEDAQRKKELEEAQEKARKEGEAQAKKQAEEKRLEDERKAKEEQEKLEKETKYKNFLKKNEGKFDKIMKEEGKVVLYKVIDEFTL